MTLLRRTATALRRQDWATVFVESALVVFGVMIALQASNWNTARVIKSGAENTLTRLHGEVEVNIASMDDRIAAIERSDTVRREALLALKNCDASPEAQETLGSAIGSLTGDIVPSFVDNSLRELARRDQFLDLLSNDFREALNIYSGRLSDERDQLNTNFGLMWDHHIMNNPMVGMTLMADMSANTFIFNEPMDVLCKDLVFPRQFAMTNVWHRSAVLRMERFKKWSEEFLESIEKESGTIK